MSDIIKYESLTNLLNSLISTNMSSNLLSKKPRSPSDRGKGLNCQMKHHDFSKTDLLPDNQTSDKNC